MSITDVVKVELFVWMKSIIAKNDGQKYYMIGQVKDHANTLLVTLAGGNGGAVMYCQTHANAYPISGTCDECRNAVLLWQPTHLPQVVAVPKLNEIRKDGSYVI